MSRFACSLSTWLLFAAVAFSGSSCASAGRNFQDKSIPELVLFESTEADAVRILGAKPYQRIRAANGNLVCQWLYVSVTLGAVKTKSVSVVFHRNGKMINFSHSTNVDLPALKATRILGIFFEQAQQGGSFAPIVSRLVPDGLAASAGWRVDDRVLSVDGEPVLSSDDVVVFTHSGERIVRYELLRDDQVVASEIDFGDGNDL